MARNFSVIVNNVAENVEDTSTTMKNLIKGYVNKRYFQALRAMNWNYINEDYQITTVAGTQDYTLPSDFNKEVYVYVRSDNTRLDAKDLQRIERELGSSIYTEGSMHSYTIFNKDDGSKIFRVYYIPNSVETIDVPYIVKPSELSDDTDQPILNLEDLLEMGATADAWRRLRQYQKAKDHETLWTTMLNEYIWDEHNFSKKPVQFQPKSFNRDNLV